MGFSLKYFFGELEYLIEQYNKEDLNQFDFIDEIIQSVVVNKKYAEECNQLD